MYQQPPSYPNQSPSQPNWPVQHPQEQQAYRPSSQPGWPPQEQQAYQSPQSQYLQQSPQYQQSMYNTPPPMTPIPPSFPPKQKSRTWIWIVALIVVFFVGYGAGHSGSSPNTGTAVNTDTKQATATQAQPTHAPTTAPQQHFKVGQVVKIGDAWQITITKAVSDQGQDPFTPKAGNVYMLVDVTMKNIGNQENSASSLVQWTLRDTDGQSYTIAVFSGANTAPDGKVEPNTQIKGTLSYEVPASKHQYTLAFEDNMFAQGQTIWDLSI